MTFREIDFCLNRISIRSHNKFAMRAALHGVKLPLIGLKESDKVQHTNSNNADKAKEAMKRAMQRRKEQKGFKMRGDK